MKVIRIESVKSNTASVTTSAAARKAARTVAINLRVVLAVVCLTLISASPAAAYYGECGQPVSTGVSPTAVDALTALRAGVGLSECDLAICDVDSNCQVTATDAMAIMSAAVGMPVGLACDANCYGPGTPEVISPAHDARGIDPADLHMEAVGFQDSDSGDFHYSSDWEVWEDDTDTLVWSYVNDTVDLVHTHLFMGEFFGSTSDTEKLRHSTYYRFRVRFRDSGFHVGPWSEWVRFRTADRAEPVPMLLEAVAASPAPVWQYDDGSAVSAPSYVGWSELRIMNTEDVVLATIDVSASTPQMVATLISSAFLASHTIDGEPQEHLPARVEIDTSDSWFLPKSVVRFDEVHGIPFEIWLPDMMLEPGVTRVFWPTQFGETYEGDVADMAPHFNGPRGRLLPLPYTVPVGYRLERVAEGLVTPTSIKVVENRGTEPTDPWFYVTEIIGNVKVVLNDGTVQSFYDGLLDFSPLDDDRSMAGTNSVCIDPASGDVFVTSTARNPSTDKLYNRVIRFNSTDGGRTADSFEEILVLDHEVVRSNHMIQFCRFGPDGKLYVMVGDSLAAGKSRDLDYFYGKVIRLNSDGSAPEDNPFYDSEDPTGARSYVWGFGYRNSFDGDFRPSDGKLLLSENGPDRDRLTWAFEGSDGFYDGSIASFEAGSAYTMGPVAHSPVGIQWWRPDVFPGSDSDVLVGSLNKRRIMKHSVDSSGSIAEPSIFLEHIGTGAGRIIDLEFGDDGLYFTPLYCNDCTQDERLTEPAPVYRVVIDD